MDCALHTQEAPPARGFTTIRRATLLRRSNFDDLGLVKTMRNAWRIGVDSSHRRA